MTAASISWDFATDLNPSSTSGGLTGSWSGMDATPTGRDASGAFYWQNQSTTVGRLLVGPPANWTPGSITFKIRRSISGTVSVNFSRGGDYTVEQTLSVTSTYSTHTIDLSGIGTVDGQIDLRFWGPGASTVRYYMDDVTVSGDVVAGSAQNIAPASIASAEAFGTPALVGLSLLEPVGIPSAEAFGVPDISEYVPPTLTLLPGGLASDEAFGVPTVVTMTEGSVPYPTGADVEEFLGADLGPAAGVHVGVITEFARVYTRGNGFYVDGLAEPLAGVILAATARLVGNPEQLDIQVGSTRRSSFFQGWTLAEQRVLNDYRKAAA